MNYTKKCSVKRLGLWYISIVKQITHDKHARLTTFQGMLIEAVGIEAAKVAQVSDVKRDQTVIVRFKSTDTEVANEVTRRFQGFLDVLGVVHQVADDCKVRMVLP